MIIVSGEPRSGTSMMMDTLRILGLNIWGEAQLENKRNSEFATTEFEKEILQKRKTDLNEKFWEVGGIVMRGINPYSMAVQKQRVMQDPSTTTEYKEQIIEKCNKDIALYEEHKNDALKIIWNGLTNTDIEVLQESKIILCLRNPLHVAKSQTRLEGNLKTAQQIEGTSMFLSAPGELTPFRYLQSVKGYINWRQKQQNKNLDILTICYDDMHFKSKETILKIIEFLELEPQEEQLNEALNNINPSKRRSAIDETPDENKAEWILVQEAYEAVLDENYEFITMRIKEHEEFQRTNPENTKWLDEDTFFPITPKMYRTMIEKPKMKQQMVASKHNREKDNLICTSCPLYNRNGEEYEIELPSDLDNIKRNKIQCTEKGEVTLEECQNHWQAINYDTKKLKSLNNTNV